MIKRNMQNAKISNRHYCNHDCKTFSYGMIWYGIIKDGNMHLNMHTSKIIFQLQNIHISERMQSTYVFIGLLK